MSLSTARASLRWRFNIVAVSSAEGSDCAWKIQCEKCGSLHTYILLVHNRNSKHSIRTLHWLLHYSLLATHIDIVYYSNEGTHIQDCVYIYMYKYRALTTTDHNTLSWSFMSFCSSRCAVRCDWAPAAIEVTLFHTADHHLETIELSNPIWPEFQKDTLIPIIKLLKWTGNW